MTILGRSAGQQPITRSGARAGDILYVTGALGGSILGRHMTFEPRVNLARELAKKFEIHAMVDLSDGLGRDQADEQFTSLKVTDFGKTEVQGLLTQISSNPNQVTRELGSSLLSYHATIIALKRPARFLHPLPPSTHCPDCIP